MTNEQDQLRVVSATREIAATPERIFELIADPFLQPRWDGNDNLAEAAEGQRVRSAGEVFTMTLTRGGVRENHVTEFEEGRRIAWTPAEQGGRPPGHLWRWELTPAGAPDGTVDGTVDGTARTMVTCTYDWTRLTDADRLPRARATTADKLLASIDRLAALAEKSAELSPLVCVNYSDVLRPAPRALAGRPFANVRERGDGSLTPTAVMPDISDTSLAVHGEVLMTRSRSVLATTATLLVAVSAVVASLVTGAGAQAATSTLCQSQTASVSGGTYIVQNNEWNSSASECITTDGNADFTVANSSISNSTSGAPGGYASVYQGCHWGACSTGGLSSSPVQASAITAGKVTTSWSTTQTGSGAYDVAYDIWFNQASTTNGQPNGAELMIWLNHNGSIQPFGSQVATNTSIGGRGYNVWFGNQGWNTISYTMTTGATSVSGLDLAPLVADAMSRGYIQPSWWLIDIEAGFELWQGGAGLKTNSFSVSSNGSNPPPTSPPPTSPPPTSPPPSGGTGACTATYSITGSWQGGFQAQVAVKNTGSTTKNGWKLTWTFPGNQTINNLWGGSFTQSGASVTVTSASYDGTLAPGATTTQMGFTAVGASGSPASVSCS